MPVVVLDQSNLRNAEKISIQLAILPTSPANPLLQVAKVQRSKWLLSRLHSATAGKSRPRNHDVIPLVHSG